VARAAGQTPDRMARNAGATAEALAEQAAGR
jgi:hypothetical protein